MDGPTIHVDISRYGLASFAIHADRLEERYRVVDHPSSLPYVIASAPPKVFIGGFENPVSGVGDAFEIHELASVVNKWPGVTLILPHTPRVETTVRRLSDWVRDGQPAFPPQFDDFETIGRFNEAVERIADHQAGLVSTELQISGFLDRGLIGSATAAQAALEFVQARYDLKVGFWDLVRDDVLRETLLKEHPLPTRPSKAAPVPIEAKRHAKQAAAKKRADKAARRRMHKFIFPLLKDRGWVSAPWLEEGLDYVLPVTGREIPGTFDKGGTVKFSLAVYKKQLVFRFLGVPHIPRDRVTNFLDRNSSLVAKVGGLAFEEGTWVLSRFPGCGWDDHGAGLTSALDVVFATIDRIMPLMPAFESFVEENIEEHHRKTGYIPSSGDYEAGAGSDSGLLTSFIKRLLGR